MIGEQVCDYVGPWVEPAKRLLSKPPEVTGIPTIGEINRDKVEAEKAKTANLRREIVTVEDIESAARESELSNDRVLRLGDERLQARMKTVELTVLKFWKNDLKIPEPNPRDRAINAVQYTLDMAWRTFPHMHQMAYRKMHWNGENGGKCEWDAKSVKTKKERDKLIGSFISGAKTTAKLITQYLYGKPGDANAVPKRERLMDAADILPMDFLTFVRLGVEGAESEPICEPAVMTAFASLKETDAHYIIYTITQ